MQLKDYFEILWRRKWAVIVTLVITVGIAGLGSALLPKTYTATCRLRLFTAVSGGSNFIDYNIQYADRLMKTYAELATSRPVLDRVGSRIARDEIPDISVDVIANTELLQITVTDSDPLLAYETTVALAEILVDQGGQLYSAALTPVLEQLPETASMLKLVSISEPAEIPTTPSGPPRMLFGVVGFVVGLLGGIAQAFIFENLDTRVYSSNQVASVTSLPVLGSIPLFSQRKRYKLATTSAEIESLRRFYVSLQSRTNSTPLTTLLITSAMPQEGKSAIAANLALICAQAGRKTVVVDADLRAPTIHRYFSLPNQKGLCQVLQGQTGIEDVLQPCNSTGLYAITSGALPADPHALISSQRSAQVFGQLARQFDLVILDAPAYMAVTDTKLLAMLVDAAVVVARHGYSRADFVRLACSELQADQVSILGTVINCAKVHTTSYYNRSAPTQVIQPAVGHLIASAAIQSPDGNGWPSHPIGYLTPPDADSMDQLTQIAGIGPVYKQALNDIHIYTLAQLAAEDPETLAQKMKVSVSAYRISQERWIEQARERLTDCQEMDVPGSYIVPEDTDSARPLTTN